MEDYRIVTAPVLIPGTPDCDYTNGEPPLTSEQITQLMTTYQEHQIIDYNHKYMFDGKWYKRNLGTPTRIWQTSDTVSYKDRYDITRTTPPGTWWQTTKVTDPEAIKLIDEGKLNAYSLTTVNKPFLERFLQISNNGISTKNKETLSDLLREYDISTKHRTPIAKIRDPVGFTVSLVDFPCVGGAVFARDCLVQSQQENNFSNKNREEDDKMDETGNNGGWSLNDVKELFGLFTSMKADNKEEEEPVKEEEPTQEEYVTKEELDATLEANNKKLIDEIGSMIDEKLEGKQEKKEEPDGENEKPSKEDEGEGNVSNKNTENNPEPTIPEPTNEGDEEMSTEETPVSQQLDDPTPQEEGEVSYKKGTPEYRILKELGRDALGNSKIRL